jgi:putative oxidoreductase
MFNIIGRPLRAIHSSWHSADAAALIIRAALGLCFIAHGGQKLFGLFGGSGIGGTTAFFRSVGIPDPHTFTYVAGILEFFGGIVIALGFLTIAAAVGLIVEMVVAIVSVSWSQGFFALPPKVGWELNVYLIALLAVLLVSGPGAWSVDATLGLTRRRSPAAAAVPSRQGGQTSAQV